MLGWIKSRVTFSATRDGCLLDVGAHRGFFLLHPGQGDANELARRRCAPTIRQIGLAAASAAARGVGKLGAGFIENAPRRILHRGLGGVDRLARHALGRGVHGGKGFPQLVVGRHRRRLPRGFRGVDRRLHRFAGGAGRGSNRGELGPLVRRRDLGAQRRQRVVCRTLRDFERGAAGHLLGRGGESRHGFAHQFFRDFARHPFGNPCGVLAVRGRRGRRLRRGRHGSREWRGRHEAAAVSG